MWKLIIFDLQNTKNILLSKKILNLMILINKVANELQKQLLLLFISGINKQKLKFEQILSNNQKSIQMSILDPNHKIRQLEDQNQRLRQTISSNRNSQRLKTGSIDFQSKYKKALKEIYEVIQANKQLKQQLDKLRISRSKVQSSMSDVRKQQIFKAYDTVLRDKNDLTTINHELNVDKERLNTQVEALQAEMEVLKNERQNLAQQKEALQANLTTKSSEPTNAKYSQQYQQLQMRYRQKQTEYHRTIQNYEQHHLQLSKQSKKLEERIQQLQQKMMFNEKTWRGRFQEKEIEYKEIKSSVRHEYQDQINNLRKEINSLKLLNTELMTKLQTNEFQYSHKNEVSQYEIEMLNGIKQLRINMEPLKKEIIALQDLDTFQKQQAEREKTTLQMKVYELESDAERYSITLKNQEDKITKLNEIIKKHNDNESIVKKFQEENKILGGRVIVLESKDIAIENRKDGSHKLQQKVLQFQTRIQMLLNEKENIANMKNITIHQLLTLKSYIAQIDQKLKVAAGQNQYATKKYKSYKDKYLSSVKEIKHHQLLENTLKSKILGYDKLVQKLQSELQKNVNMSQMQIINVNAKSTNEQSQIETIKQKYQMLKQKLVIQQRYNKQELETIKLNYETKIVDLSIRGEQINTLRESISLYKQKNQDLMSRLVQKENQILDVRLSFGKKSVTKNDNELTIQNQGRQIISSLQQQIHKQQAIILKLQTQIRTQQDANRKRIGVLERQLQDKHDQFNKVKLSASTKNNNEKNTEEISTENRRLKNKISELENEIILIKGTQAQETTKSNYQLQFRIASLDIEKNELVHKLETQTSYKKRLEKQMQQLMNKNNQLDSELTQLNVQTSRKLQQVKFELNDRQSIIENLEEEIKTLRNQQRSNLQASTLRNSVVVPKQDHSICQNKIQRLERELQTVKAENEQLRAKVSSSTFSYGNNFNYELQSLRNEKQEAKFKLERLQKQLAGMRLTLSNYEEEKYEFTRNINSMKSQINSEKLRFQDDLFEKDRMITQLRTKLQHTEANSANTLNIHNELGNALQEKERQVAILRSKLTQAEDAISQLNTTINRYAQDIANLKKNSEYSNNEMRQSLQQKQATISTLKYKLTQAQGAITQLNETTNRYNQEMYTLKRANQQSNQQYSQQLQQQTRQKQRQINVLKVKLSQCETTIEQMNDTINNYNQQLMVLKRSKDSQQSSYTQQVQLIIQEKQKTLSKYKDQISSLTFDINQKIEELSLKDESIIRLQRQIHDYREYEQEVERLRGSLNDRQGLLSKNRFQIANYEEEAERVKKQVSYYKEQLQKVKFDMLERDDQVSSLKLEVSNIQIRLTNQIKNEYIEQIAEKQNQISRLNFTVQSLQNNFSALEYEHNETEARERKLQSQVSYARSQLQQYQQQFNDLSQRFNRRQSQFNQISNEVVGLRLLQDQLNERNLLINKIKGQMTQLRISSSQLQQQIEYKQSTILRLNNEVKNLRQQIYEKQQHFSSKESQLYSLTSEINRLKSLAEDNELQFSQKQSNIQRLTSELNKIKQQNKDLQEEMQERQHQWSNIQYQLNQAKSKINLISDEIDGKDILITKLSNQSAFLKQQITRLNEENVDKNHQINRINQQVFLHKMEISNQANEQTQALSNQNFSLQRQIQTLKHNIEDLQSENRRMRIQINDSRVKFSEINSTYMYTEEDIQGYKEENNNKYREIMELQLQLSQRTSEIQLINQKADKLQLLLSQYEQENQYNNDRYQKQIQSFMQNEKRLQEQLETLKNTRAITSQQNQNQSQTHQELKFGLHLYTEQTDRLQSIISGLSEEVNALKLKLTAMNNQEDRLQENLVTMVMTFAEVESLRQRMKVKEEEINQVRKSLIKAVSSNEDINSQYKFKSSKIFKSEAQNNQAKQPFEEVQSKNQMSIMHFKSQQGEQKEQLVEEQQQSVKHLSEYEIHKAKGPKEMSEEDQVDDAELLKNQRQLNQLAQQEAQSQDKQEAQNQEILTHSLVEEVRVNQAQHETEELITSQQQQRNVSTSVVQQVIPQMQRPSRTINITYQGPTVQTSGVQLNQQQRISQSQASGPVGYVRVVPRGPTQQVVHVSGPVQGYTQITNQGHVSQQIQQQGGNRIIISNQPIQGRPIIKGSIPPQNLRY